MSTQADLHAKPIRAAALSGEDRALHQFPPFFFVFAFECPFKPPPLLLLSAAQTVASGAAVFVTATKNLLVNGITPPAHQRLKT